MSIAYRSLPRPTMPPAPLRADLDSFSDRAASPSEVVVVAVRDAALDAELRANIPRSRFVVLGREDIGIASVVVLDARGDAFERTAEARKLSRADAAVVVVVASSADAAGALRAGALAAVERVNVGGQIAGVLASAVETHADEATPQLTAAVSAEEHLASIERMGAGVAHELGGPLGIAAMNLGVMRGEIAQLGREDPQAIAVLAAALQDVESSIERMNALLITLGSFASRGPVDIDQISVADTVASVLHRAAETLRGIEVESCIEPLTAHADPGMLEQILLQLTTNAAQASRGLPAARVRYHVYASGDRVVLSVRDNGPGIGPEARRRIFEPFYTTRRSQGGRGLGLAICREYARRMGGVLSMWSEPGRGACFRLSLPA